jgi:hypothetical protein
MLQHKVQQNVIFQYLTAQHFLQQSFRRPRESGDPFDAEGIILSACGFRG